MLSQDMTCAVYILAGDLRTRVLSEKVGLNQLHDQCKSVSPDDEKNLTATSHLSKRRPLLMALISSSSRVSLFSLFSL